LPSTSARHAYLERHGPPPPPRYIMSSSSRSTSKTSTSSMPPDGASCWLCLEDGPDDSGAPLVRDCSCRGHSGFAHLPCLVKYGNQMAEQALRKVEATGTVANMVDIFYKCPNCKQDYQNGILVEMKKANITFHKEKLMQPGADKISLAIESAELEKRLRNINGRNKNERDEGLKIVTKLLSISRELKQCDCLPIPMGAGMDEHIGDFFESCSDDHSLKRAKAFYEKARDAIVAWGGEYKLDRKGVDYKIKRVEAKLGGGSGNDRQVGKAAAVKLLQERYDYCVALGNDNDTITAGINLASVLHTSDHAIEAERLLDKLIVTSRRVHGSNHNQTQKCLSLLQAVKERWVILHSEQQWFEALKYKKNGKKCVIQGPIKEPRVTDEEKTITVPSGEVRPYKGTPVMFHGLKKAAHLNGKIGDVREFCQSADRYEVHLEDKGLKPVLAKHGNLKVLFDLPDPKKESS